MIDGAQIFTTEDLLDRIDANEAAKNLTIYAGHIDDGTKNAVTMFYIARQPGDPWPSKKLAELQKLRGNFTAVFRPGNEVMFCTSDRTAQFNYGYPMQGMEALEITPHHGKEMQTLIKDVVRLEKEVAELKTQLQEKNEELAYYADGRNKFAGALEDVFMRFIPRLLPETKEFFNNQNTAPMQGQNWQQIDVSGNTDQHVENALAVMLEAFGDENILKFARMIQLDPGKVQMLIKFL